MRRGTRRRRAAATVVRCFLLAAALVPLDCAAERMSPVVLAGEPENGAPQVSKLSLVVKVGDPEVLVGGSMPVEVTLRNDGPDPVEVVGADSPSEFEFVLRPTAPGVPALTLSAARARIARDPNPVPRLPRETVTLAPGASERYFEDLAHYATAPVAPGRYELSVAWGPAATATRSPPAPLTVAPPAIRALACSASACEQSVATVFVHAGSSGAAGLFQRVSPAGSPQDGMALRRSDVPEAVAGLASAVEIERDELVLRGRWFAWLTGASLTAGVGQRSASSVCTAPLDLGLREPTLCPVGWQQPGANEAVFLALGLDGGGTPALAWVTFSARERKGSARISPLAGSALPSAWTARLRRAGGALHADVVLAEVTAAGTRVSRRSVTPGAPPAVAPLVLTLRAEPLAALALAPVAGDGAGSVDLLFGPSGTPPQMTFLRLALDGGAPLMEASFPAAASAGEAPSTDWALVPASLPQPVVLARSGDRIVGRAIGVGASGTGAHEFVVEPKAAGAARLQLHAVAGGLWAVWADPALGVRFRKLP